MYECRRHPCWINDSLFYSWLTVVPGDRWCVTFTAVHHGQVVIEEHLIFFLISLPTIHLTPHYGYVQFFFNIRSISQFLLQR